MTEILSHYEPITLEQMKDIRLMNRIDTKFVTTEPMLRRLLVMACDDYFVQETDGLRISPYYTLYFDTPDCAMYNRHQVGHLSRQKIRIRSYVKAGLNFLEVKTKNNHGRTKKKRIAMEQFDALHPQHDIQFHRQDENFINYDEFLRATLKYDPENLTEQLENRFDRITLVNKSKTERLTIDTNLHFHNLVSGIDKDMGNLVIIELKRDGLQPSPIMEMLRRLHIHPHGFSKYCMGSALTNPKLQVHRFKPKLIEIRKIINNKKQP